jgi:outer membrane lipoprotein-sorting protein
VNQNLHGGASVLASRDIHLLGPARRESRPTKFILPVLVAMILLFAFCATAETTNTLPDAEIQGHQLAQQLLQQQPVTNFVQTGVLKIRDAQGKRSEIPIVCKIVVTVFVAGTNITIPDWQTFYQAALTNQSEYLRVIHTTGLTNLYSYSTNASDAVPVLGDIPLVGHLFGSHQVSGPALMSPFAGSDFWIADLGLEFFHWPAQKVLKKEVKRSRGCTVLESTNPDPTTNGYSRIVCWIDSETLGIVQAQAYDAQGKLLKEFYPKDIKKVKGQWQVESMEIDNVQTNSSTWLKFDLKAP